MSIRNPVNPQDPRAAAGTYPAAKPRHQHRPLGTRSENKRGLPNKDQKPVEAAALTADAVFEGKSKVTPGGTERVEYKGYTLSIEPHRAGWKVAIFPKGSPFAHYSSPYTAEITGRDVVVEQAKAIVDEATADMTSHEIAIEPAKISTRRSSTLVAVFLRLRRALSQGWMTLKRAYFSVGQPPRADS